MQHVGDIRTLSAARLEPVDVVIGGSPCQGLSEAGERGGLNDTRSALFLEQIRIVKELRNYDERIHTPGSVRPRFMVWENVPGAFTCHGGEDFRRVLEEVIRIAEPSAPRIPLPGSEKWPMADCWYGWGGDGPLPTEYSTHSFGERPKDGAESRLSQILEGMPHRRYYLSAKACKGILQRHRDLPEDAAHVMRKQACL